ncbi:MAG: chromate transporter [Eubacteriales bacterium]|nr:chromate transporter [Eubacteriales bacterium]
MPKDKKIYWTLFSSTFYLSAFTVGGGYVIVPLMKKKFADELGWIDEKEMLNIVAIAQSAPGPIAVNASILLGYRVAGLPGALLAILGTVLPPLILLSVISLFYEAFRDNRVVAAVLKGMQAGVAAVIVDVVCTMGLNVVKTKSWLSIAVMVCAFAAVFFLKINVVWVILACAVIGAVRALIEINREKKKGGAA